MFIPLVSLSFSLSLYFFTSPLLLRACADLWNIHLFCPFFPVWILSRKPRSKIVIFVLSRRRSFNYAKITVHLQCKYTTKITRLLFTCVYKVKFLTHSKFGHGWLWAISIRNFLRPYMCILVGSKTYMLSLNRKEASCLFYSAISSSSLSFTACFVCLQGFACTSSRFTLSNVLFAPLWMISLGGGGLIHLSTLGKCLFSFWLPNISSPTTKPSPCQPLTSS